MDEDLQHIKACLAGDQAAFGLLVHKYKRYVYTITFRILRNAEDAEEAAQDTFIKVYKNIALYEGKSKFTTWLYSIAYRTGIDYQRRQKPNAGPKAELKMLNTPGSEEEQPHAMLATSDKNEWLNKALLTLEPESAGLVTLFYIQELSVKEIVEQTGITESNVKVKLYRAREKLRKVLANALRTEWDELVTD